MAGSGTNFFPAPPRGRRDSSAGAPAVLQGKQMTANRCVRPLRDASKPDSCASALAAAAAARRGMLRIHRVCGVMSRIGHVSGIMQMASHLAHPRLQLPHLRSRYPAHLNQSICSILWSSATRVAGAVTVGSTAEEGAGDRTKADAPVEIGVAVSVVIVVLLVQ